MDGFKISLSDRSVIFRDEAASVAMLKPSAGSSIGKSIIIGVDADVD